MIKMQSEVTLAWPDSVGLPSSVCLEYQISIWHSVLHNPTSFCLARKNLLLRHTYRFISTIIPYLLTTLSVLMYGRVWFEVVKVCL